MIDTHCHLDLYPHPAKEASDCERKKITTIVVTNLPSAFKKLLPLIKQYKYIRFALGLHPLLANEHLQERNKFLEYVDRTSYIGEIGLDFSVEGVSTKEIQIESFNFVLRSIRKKNKFISLHSRKAEATVLDILEEMGISPVIFHWYSGTLQSLERVISNGHYLSVNPAMINSKNGRNIIENTPRERILTETDGPFVKIGNRNVSPTDVSVVEKYLAKEWNIGNLDVTKLIYQNFYNIIKSL